jgi:hypothetical protein
LIQKDELWSFLEVGYAEFLPDEFLEGQTSTDQLVEDFIKLIQQHLETVPRPDLEPKKETGKRSINPKQCRFFFWSGEMKTPRSTTCTGSVEEVVVEPTEATTSSSIHLY